MRKETKVALLVLLGFAIVSGLAAYVFYLGGGDFGDLGLKLWDGLKSIFQRPTTGDSSESSPSLIRIGHLAFNGLIRIA